MSVSDDPQSQAFCLLTGASATTSRATGAISSAAGDRSICGRNNGRIANDGGDRDAGANARIWTYRTGEHSFLNSCVKFGETNRFLDLFEVMA